MKKIIFIFIFLVSCHKNDNIKIDIKKQNLIDKPVRYKESFMKSNRTIYINDDPTSITKKYILNNYNYALVDLDKYFNPEDYPDDINNIKFDPYVYEWFYNFEAVDSVTNSCFVSIIDYNHTHIRRKGIKYNIHDSLFSRQKISYEHYPMILLNKNCDSDSLFVGNNFFLCIQEALDKDGIWKPINRLPDSYNDSFMYSLKFKNKEFIVVLLPKYEGDFKTKLRVRWRNGKKVYISDTFTGKINRNFLLQKKDILFYKYKTYATNKSVSKRFLGNKFATKLINEIMNK